MAIYAYTGPPGSGKSYAMIAQQLVPALGKNRRIVTNIDGVKPDACHDYAVNVLGIGDPSPVVTFHGEQAQLPGFWPTEIGGDAETFIKAGDLVLFDEWAMYFPPSGKLPTDDVELFLRIHRHLTNEDGTACDVAIGTQIIGDVHRKFRGVVERSYKFKKLKAVGAPKFYSWHAYEGHTQRRSYSEGNGRYDPSIFALYKSYGGEGQGVEQSTDSRTTIYGKGFYAAGILAVLLILGGGYFTWSFFSGEGFASKPLSKGSEFPEQQQAESGPVAPIAPPRSEWRIVGYFNGNTGLRVVLGNRGGEFRTVDSTGYDFDGLRPIRGTYQGQEVRSEDWLEAPDNPTSAPYEGDPYAPRYPAGSIPGNAVIQSGPGPTDYRGEAVQP